MSRPSRRGCPIRQAKRGAEPPATRKMAAGCAITAVAYALLSFASVDVSPDAPVALPIPLAVVGILTVGELFVSPVGLSLIGAASKGSATVRRDMRRDRMASACAISAISQALGFWFVAGGFGGALAGQLGTLYATWAKHRCAASSAGHDRV